MASVLAVPATAQTAVIYGVCSFPITHEFPKVHIAHSGPLPTSSAPFEGFDTGQVFVRITNVLNGKSVEVNANSAAFYMDDGTAFFRGESVTFFSSRRGDIPAGVWVVVGSVHVTFGQDGSIQTATGGVLRRDICSELS
jgi:hypothetical protein